MEENLRRIYSGEMDLSSENEKTTLTVDEDDILQMADAIRQNRIEDKLFEDNLDRFLESNTKTSEYIFVCKTSNALAISGADKELDVVIAPRTIAKCMADPSVKYHGHQLTKDILQHIPRELRNPVMIFKGSKDKSLVAITKLRDNNSHSVIVAISIGEADKFRTVNRISSVYGKDNINNYIRNQISYGNLISANKKEADKMLHSAGLQLPLENTFISFNNSISYTVQNVKGFEEKTGQKIKEERKSKMRVFFDMDGTLNKITNSLMDENGSVQLEKMYKTENFFEHVEPKEKMIELVNKLSEDGVEVFCLSSCELGDPPGFEKQKDRWLDKHSVNIDQENRIYVPYGKDKTDYIPGGLQDGDVLIDDYNLNLKEWQNKAVASCVNAKVVKAVNSLNDKGLGALGGDKGNIWNGDRVYTSFSAELNANTILNLFSVSKPEELNLEVNTNHKKVMYDAYYYLDMIGSDGLANIEIQSGSRALFSVLQPPNSEQAYLLCDSFDTDGYTLSNLETPCYTKHRQSAINEFVYRQAVDPKGSDDCLLLLKEEELNKAVHYIRDKMPELYDRLSKMVGSMANAEEVAKPEYKYGLATLSVRKVSGTRTYEVYGTRDGNEKFLFSSDAPTLPFFVDQINSTISANRYRTEREDKQSEVDESQDNEAVVLGNKKFHR